MILNIKINLYLNEYLKKKFVVYYYSNLIRSFHTKKNLKDINLQVKLDIGR